MLELSAAEARRLALTAQGFAGSKGAGAVTRAHIRGLLARIALVQIDSVNVLVRSHYLPVFSRLGPYRRELLDEMAYTHRDLFEYWGHQASLISLEMFPLMRWRMNRIAARPSSEDRFAKWSRENKASVEKVYREVEARGPLAASELEKPGGRTGPWWGWSDGKTILEWLFYCGRVTTSDRRNFERVYDLTERLFGFRYRIEIYVPTPRRVHGYYVLPFLLGDRLVARVDLKADRATGKLLVQGAFHEPGERPNRVAGPLADELRSMAAWLELERVFVGRRGMLAAALRKEVSPRVGRR